MKFIIGSIVCMCLVGIGHAQPLSLPAPFSAQLLSVMEDMTHIGESAGKALVRQYEEIVVEPQHQLDAAIDQLESCRTDNPQCVAAHDEQISSIVDNAHEELHVCGLSAAHESAEIVTDVNRATQQLVFGGYALGRTYNKCNNYKNTVLKQSCMAKFYVQTTIYLVNARSSLKTITHSTNERIPAVLIDSNTCTHLASEKAVSSLDAVTADVDACIAQTPRR